MELLWVEQGMSIPEWVLRTGNKHCGQLGSINKGTPPNMTEHDSKASACVVGGKKMDGRSTRY